MGHLVDIAAFWIAVVVVIRLAVYFPRSLLARILFARVGPMPRRGESEVEYFRRWARFGASWLIQAVLVFCAGWMALQFDAELFDSLAFAVLWMVIVPLFGVGALVLAIAALARSVWVQRIRRSRAVSNSGCISVRSRKRWSQLTSPTGMRCLHDRRRLLLWTVHG